MKGVHMKRNYVGLFYNVGIHYHKKIEYHQIKNCMANPFKIHSLLIIVPLLKSGNTVTRKQSSRLTLHNNQAKSTTTQGYIPFKRHE